MTDRESGLPRLDSLTIRLVTASDDAEFAATGLPWPSSRGAEEAGLATKTTAVSAAMARSERMAPPGRRGLMLVCVGHELEWAREVVRVPREGRTSSVGDAHDQWRPPLVRVLGEG